MSLPKITVLWDRLDELEAKIAKLEAKVFYVAPEITKVEPGETAPPLREETTMKMDDDDKITSMRNAIKILPPNMIVNGRHDKKNVQAICGFMVTDAMMDRAYGDILH